jgi:hypothetical protein
MSELGTLFFIVLLVYLVQCIVWVAPGSSIFVPRGAGEGRRKKQGFIWNAFELAGVLANPLPPLQPLTVADWPDFQLSAEGCRCQSKEGPSLIIPWEKLVVTATDSRLLCNGTPVLKAGEAQIRECAQMLARIRKLKSAKRTAAIESWVRGSLREHSVRRRLQVFRGRSQWLRILANLQFFLLFVAAPLGFQLLGLRRMLWPLVASIVLLSIYITVEFRTLHKTMTPEAGGTRLKAGLTMLLSPVAAVRSCDVVSRDLFAGYHPLAVAAVLLPEKEFRAFAGEQLRECRFGEEPAGYYGKTMERLMEQLIRRQGIVPEELMRPREREGKCVAYCPRCLAQYLKERSECPDCGHPGLVPFPAA